MKILNWTPVYTGVTAALILAALIEGVALFAAVIAFVIQGKAAGL